MGTDQAGGLFRDDFSNFLYSGIGLAVVFTSMNRMGGFNLSSILFGSLMTISSSDLWIVAGLGILPVFLWYFLPAAAVFDL